jgi:hypothetical protein
MGALIWNTRLRMERGVGVAGHGVSLLNGQTTMRDSIASVEGLCTEQRFRIRDQVAKYTSVMSRKFLLLFTETKAALSVEIVRAEFNLKCPPKQCGPYMWFS